MFLKDTYIKILNPGNDKYLGRIVAGLPHGSYEFGSLPPYFHPGFDYDWCEVVPCYDVLPLTFKRVVPFLVVFHNTWLRSYVHSNHPIFRNTLWTKGLLPQLEAVVFSGITECSNTELRATGLSPNLLRLSNIDKSLQSLTEKVETITASTNDLKESILNGINLCNNNITPNAVIHTSNNSVEYMQDLINNSVEYMQDLINETIESKFESFKSSLLLSNLNISTAVSHQSNIDHSIIISNNKDQLNNKKVYNKIGVTKEALKELHRIG